MPRRKDGSKSDVVTGNRREVTKHKFYNIHPLPYINKIFV